LLSPSSYAFRTEDRSILTIDSIGWQRICSPAYCNDGLERPDVGHVIFQYTLSGHGWLEIDQQRIPLPKGTGFLVKVPSKHRYYKAEQEEPWEIIWLNLRGDEADRVWDLVIGKEGPILRRETDSPDITGFWKIMHAITEEKVTDKYQLSALAYEWMLNLVRTSRELSKEMSANSITMMEKAKRFMMEHFAEPLTLDMIADHCRVNKHYFCRLFQKSEHTSPLAYLRDRRVEAALGLLRTTELSVYEIGQRCGFDSPSYFGKVFRTYMNMTPKEYRLKKLEFPYDAVFYER
jgi:AraC-like DNA-binding protein